MFVRTSFWRNRIVTAASPRMAAQNAFGTKVTSVKQPVYF